MNTLTRKLRKMKKDTMTWRELAEKVGYDSPGLIYKAYHGKCDSPTLRKALGLPPAHIETEPCQKCGGVHKLKSCRKENRKQEKRYRVALEFDSEEDRDRAIKAFERLGKTRKLQSQWLVILALGHLLDRFDREQGVTEANQ